MPTIISTQIISIPRGNNEDDVTFVFTLDTGDIVRDGPRFMVAGDDQSVKAADIGARLLESLAQQEIAQWLSA